HHDSRRLLWMCDIKLIAESLSDPDWTRVWALAREKEVVAVCHESLEAAAEVLGSDVCRRHARDDARASRREPSAVYLADVGTGWRSVWLDIRHARGVGRKLGLIGAHAFPDPKYMRDTYGATNSMTLAAAYVRRAA